MKTNQSGGVFRVKVPERNARHSARFEMLILPGSINQLNILNMPTVVGCIFYINVKSTYCVNDLKIFTSINANDGRFNREMRPMEFQMYWNITNYGIILQIKIFQIEMCFLRHQLFISCKQKSQYNNNFYFFILCHKALIYNLIYKYLYISFLSIIFLLIISLIFPPPFLYHPATFLYPTHIVSLHHIYLAYAPLFLLYLTSLTYPFFLSFPKSIRPFLVTTLSPHSPPISSWQSYNYFVLATSLFQSLSCPCTTLTLSNMYLSTILLLPSSLLLFSFILFFYAFYPSFSLLIYY